jgi:xylulokinase
MDAVTVGVDIGTSAVKALAVTDDGTVAAAVRRPHPLIAGPDRLEHDAEVAWHRNVQAAYDEVAAGREILAAVVAAMVPSLTAVDGDGVPCAPGLLYGDARGQGLAGASPESSGETAGFLAWLAIKAPHAAGYWPAQAVGTHALSGNPAIDYASAFCMSPPFDGTEWAEEAARQAGAAPSQLPRVVTDLEPVGLVSPGGAAVGAGTVDALAAQYVAGADQPGDVLVVLGATLIAWLVVDEWVECPGLWTVPHTAPGLCLVGGASNAGGLFMDWLRRLMGNESASAETGHPDPNDIPVWLPYLRGERTPLPRTDLRGVLEDLHLGHGAPAVARAAREASGFVLRRILERVHDSSPSGPPPQRIVAVGGGVRDDGWVAALADATGLPVAVTAVPDATAHGAAFVARCVAGLEPAPTEGRRWATTARIQEPDPVWMPACEQRYQRFLTLNGDRREITDA